MINVHLPYDPITNNYDMNDIAMQLAEEAEEAENQATGLASNELDPQ